MSSKTAYTRRRRQFRKAGKKYLPADIMNLIAELSGNLTVFFTLRLIIHARARENKEDIPSYLNAKKNFDKLANQKEFIKDFDYNAREYLENSPEYARALRTVFSLTGIVRVNFVLPHLQYNLSGEEAMELLTEVLLRKYSDLPVYVAFVIYKFFFTYSTNYETVQPTEKLVSLILRIRVGLGFFQGINMCDLHDNLYRGICNITNPKVIVQIAKECSPQSFLSVVKKYHYFCPEISRELTNLAIEFEEKIFESCSLDFYMEDIYLEDIVFFYSFLKNRCKYFLIPMSEYTTCRIKLISNYLLREIANCEYLMKDPLMSFFYERDLAYYQTLLKELLLDWS